MKSFIRILALLALGVVLGATAQAQKKRLIIDLVTREGALISPAISNLEWRPGSKQISYIRHEGPGRGASALWVFDIATKEEKKLLGPGGEMGRLNLASYQWSPKGDALLLQGENDLWLYDLQRGHAKRLTNDADAEEDPTFSPAGDRVAYVKKNNIFVLALQSDESKELTQDGNDNVLNGKLDWVYEEELANRATGRAYEWSPDGKKIAYLRLDDTPVPKYPLTSYLSTHVGLTFERFPQSGDPNPVASFHAVTVDGNETKDWSLPSGASIEYFGPSFSWTPDSSAVSFLTLNRGQNQLTAGLWTPFEGSTQALVVEEDSTWINSLDPPHFLKGGRRFLWLSERDGWLHLYLYDREAHTKQLTHGHWQIDPPITPDATALIGDEEGWVYFEATEKDPRERHLYRVRLDGTGLERLTKETGTHSAHVSPDGSFFTDTYSNVDEPPQIRLLKSDGSFIATLDKPQNHLSEYALARTEFVEFKATDGITLYGRLAKPADFDPAKKYPVIVFVYGGPHAQVIQNRWGETTLLDHLFTEEGFLVWSMDNRGSWGRGHAWESAIFKDMGRHELEDQLAGVSYLKRLPYVDGNRLGIWGWSYGGYMTLFTLTHAPDVFKCGAAGGPVTDWKFYDSIYTERYMRTPKENVEGYKTSSPLEAADKLKANLLLIHGADDDNVHMQNTMNFVDALVKAGRPFDLYIQPGQKHGFRGDAVRTYLNTRLLEFFKKNL